MQFSRIEEIADIIDSLHKTPRYSSTGHPMVRVVDVKYGSLTLKDTRKVDDQVFLEFSRRFTPEINDIVITRVGSYGISALVKDTHFCLGQNTAALKPRVNKRFFYFALNSPFVKAQIEYSTVGSTQKTLSLKAIGNLEIPRLGEKDEQLTATFLGSLDDKIELNRQMNTVLEGMARAVFVDWFVDFGPTRRKMAGEADPVKILGGAICPEAQAQKTAALFPDRLGQNGLPEGWEEKPFSDLVHIIGGGTPKTKNAEYWNGDIPWFSVVDTPSGSDTFVFGTQKQITQAGLENSSAKLIEAGTTIISARGTVGNLAIAGESMTFNQSCYALKGKNQIGKAFTYLGAQRLVQDFQRMAHGAVFSTITRSTFAGVEFAFPPGGLCDDFEELMLPLFAKIKANVEENQTLAEMRDLLLPKLMSGEIRLREAE